MDSGQKKDESPWRWERIALLPTFILNIFAIYKFLYSEWSWFSTALLVSTIILLWVFALSICVRKTTLGERFGTPSKVPAYPIGQRRVARAGLVLIPALVLAWSYYQSLPSERVIVAVAEFQGPDPQSYRVTELLLAHLRQVTKGYPEILILPLGRTISEQEGSSLAQAEGHKVKATAVIWGWYGKTEEKVLLTSNLDLLRPLKHSFPVDRDICTSPASDLNRFRVQEDLSTRLAYLVLTTVGLIKLDAQDYQEAVTFLTNALAQKSVSEGMKYSAYFFRAFSHQQGGDSDRAIADYTASIKLKADIPESYNNRGNSYYRKGEYAMAISDYGEALRLKPTYAEAYNNRGAAFNGKALYQSAISDLDKAVELNPNYLDAYLNRGYAYMMEKKNTLAVADYNHAIQLGPGDSRGYIDRAGIYLETGNYEGALKDLNHVLQAEPNNAKAHNNRGVYYFKLGNFNDAEKEFSTAITLDRNYAEAHNNRASAYANMGQLDLAVEDSNQAILLRPSYAEAYYNRGNTWKQKGQIDLAITDYSRATNLNPRHLEHT